MLGDCEVAIRSATDGTAEPRNAQGSQIDVDCAQLGEEVPGLTAAAASEGAEGANQLSEAGAVAAREPWNTRRRDGWTQLTTLVMTL